MNKAIGTDLPIAVKGLATLWNIYGEQVKDVTHLTNVMKQTHDLAKVTMTELATLMPNAATAARIFGFSIEEVGAAIAVATQKGGRSERTFTALRGTFAKLEDGVKKLGIAFKKGDPLEKVLGQINEKY